MVHTREISTTKARESKELAQPNLLLPLERIVDVVETVLARVQHLQHLPVRNFVFIVRIVLDSRPRREICAALIGSESEREYVTAAVTITGVAAQTDGLRFIRRIWVVRVKDAKHWEKGLNMRETT